MTNNTSEIEQQFLGCLLIARAGELPAFNIKAHFFDDKRNGRIFQAYFKQLKNGTAPDIQTLALDPDLTDIGAAYIASLTNIIPSAVNIQYFETKIIKAYKSRTFAGALKTAQERITSAGYTGDIDPVIREFMAITAGAMNDKV